MTLEDIKHSSGYRFIVNYSQHITSLDGLGALGVYTDNNDYYKDFYIAYQNKNTCLKVKMIVVPDATGYTVTSGYITLSASATDMLITNAKTMGMCPTTPENCSEMLNDWYTAVNNDARLKQGIMDIYGQTETVPMWYSLADEYLHVNSDYLDLIYNYLYEKYGSNGGTGQVYKYNEREYETGTYIVPSEYHDKVDVIVSGLDATGETGITQVLSSDDIYDLINQVITDDDPLAEAIKNSNAIRVMFHSVTYPYYDIIICGHYVNNPVTVNNDGSISAGVTRSVTARKSNHPSYTDYAEWTYNNTVLPTGQGATYSTEWLTGGSADIDGVSYHQGLLCDCIVDQIFFTGNLAPYEVTGDTPNSNPREQVYTTWVDTVDNPDPDPDPDPDDRHDPVPPDPVVIVDPQPPRKVDPTIEDEESDVDTYEDDPPDNNKALGNIYDLGTDGTKLGQLADQLYDPTNVERICQVWKNNPNESIISLHYMYIQPDKQSGAVVKLGNFNTNINADYVTSRYKMFDCGSRAIERKFKNAMDYQTNISLYLPFSGIHQLDINEVMNSKIHIKGCVDVISGDILYSILVNRKNSNGTYVYDNKCLYTFTGNCKVDIPFSSSSLNSGMVSGIGGVLSSIVSKNPIGALTGAVGTAVGGSTNVSHGGSLSGNTGAMGYKYPYLIIEYPKVIDVSLRGKLYGYKSNQTVQVSQLSGYAEFEKVHVDTISCSDEDRQEIERILKDGIII